MNIQFGTGVLFMAPNSGNTAANPTPQRLGILQEVTVDFKADLKKLYGQKQLPVATARGKIDVTAKGKFAAFNPTMLNQVYFGQIQTAGIMKVADQEAQTVPNTPGPYTITVTHVAGVPIVDLGVTYADGTPFSNQTPSAAGEYTVNLATGVYTFNSADANKPVLISYMYSVSTEGVTIALANQLMGYAPYFEAVLYNNFRGKYLSIQLNSCVMGDFSMPTKLEDFWIPDFTFSAETDANDVLGAIYADLI